MTRPRFICLLLALTTLVVYLPVWHHAFLIFDDLDYVSNNSIVQAGLSWAGAKWAFTTWHSANWHPLTWLSHMLDCELFGQNAGAHLLVNVLFHMANTILLFLLLLRWTGALWPGAFVAALFAWHPLHVESIAWVAERKDVLSTFFGLLSLRAYGRHVQRPSKDQRCAAGANVSDRVPHSRLWTSDYSLALLFFALSLMAKPMLVTLPFVLLLLDFWPLQRISRTQRRGIGSTTTFNFQFSTLWHLAWEKWPFFLLTAGSCVMTFLAQSRGAVVPLELYPFGLRAENAIVSYGRYLLKAAWPAHLAITYPLQHWPVWQVALATAALASISLVAWSRRRESPYMLMGWLWFLGTLVPVIGVVQVGQQAMADRYTYLPLVGVFVALAYGVRDLVARFHFRTSRVSVAAGLVLGSFLVVTEHQLQYWQDTETLFGHALVVTKDDATAHLTLGAFFEEQGRRDEALNEFREALRVNESVFVRTLSETKFSLASHLLLATAFEQQGRRDEALEQYREALRVNHASAEAHNDLANLLDEMGRPDEALVHYREAVRLKPDAPLAHDNLGTLLIKLGQFDEAMRQYAEASRLQPDDPRTHYLMGKAWLRRGQSAEAITQFRDALRRDGNNFQTLTCLARVLASDENPRIRNGPEAVALAEQANALTDGRQPFVLDTLAMAYAETSRFVDAQQAVQKAVGIAVVAGERDSVSNMQRRLNLYQSGRPYREAFTNAQTQLR